MESVFYFLSGILSILYFVHIPWFLSHFCSYRKMHTWITALFCISFIVFLYAFPVNQIFYTETSSLLWVISFLFQIYFTFFSIFITAYFIYKIHYFSVLLQLLYFFLTNSIHYLHAFSLLLFSNFFITTELLSSSLRTILLNLFTIIFLHSFVYFSNRYPLRFKKK